MPDRTAAPQMSLEAEVTLRERLREREEILLMAERSAGIGIWEIDLANQTVRGTPQFWRVMGLPPTDQAVPIETTRRLRLPEDRAKVAHGFDDVLENHAETFETEYRIRRPDGEIRWIFGRGRLIRDTSGRALRYSGIDIDVTDRKAGEAALAAERSRQLDASKAQIKAIFDNSPDWQCLFRATADDRFVYEDLNHATEEGYGLQREQVIGLSVEEILGAEQAQLPLAHMRACIATGQNQRYTARRTLAGVMRTIDVMFVRVPEKDRGDYLIMSTARDITAREEMEQQLRQAQKMEAFGHLTGGVAHDFNNLLTAIIGNLELLQSRLEDDQIAEKHLGAAQRAAENGAKLTEQLLAFSRRQHLQPRATNLNTVVRGMLEMLTRTIGPTIEVRTNLSSGLWPALVDPTQIEIAILNLAINSRDAMPMGGILSIETGNLGAGIESAGPELANEACVHLVVRDTGTGMSEEVSGRAVEPFFTTKEPGKGSGLGLSQVYGLVRQSNGCLRIESQFGQGTSMHLYFPRAAGQLVDAENPQNQPPSPEICGRVLVVDDDPAVREITALMLRQTGYGVVEAESGHAALAALERGEVYDLVVIDVAMPGLNGVETIRHARERSPALRVLFMTGLPTSSGRNNRLRANQF